MPGDQAEEPAPPAHRTTRRRWITFRHVARAVVFVAVTASGVVLSWVLQPHPDGWQAVLAVGQGLFFGGAVGLAAAVMIPLHSGMDPAELKEFLRGSSELYDRERDGAAADTEG